MTNFRDIEKISAYLDGQLGESELKRLETRLASDAGLASVLTDLRAVRGILRKLPKRKAPRNFALTRQMVGLKPPLPRTYPVFRFATVFATLLLMVSFTVNAMSPYVSFGAPSGTAFGYGGGCEEPCEAFALEAPAQESAPMMESMPVAPTMTAADSETEEPSMKSMDAPEGVEDEPLPTDQARAGGEAPIPVGWILSLFILALLSGAVTWLMRRSAAQKWR
jgi:hypothetical protein